MINISHYILLRKEEVYGKCKEKEAYSKNNPPSYEQGRHPL